MSEAPSPEKSNSPTPKPWEVVVKPTAPFDEQGDVVLRTADGQDFHVHRIVLSLASPFFRTMFSLPQPSSNGGSAEGGQDKGDALPLIDVSENSYTIDVLLRQCYPVAKPSLVDIECVDLILAAALKYDMSVAIQTTCDQLVSPAIMTDPVQPLRAFFIACKHKLQREALVAAKATLRYPIDDVYVNEMEEVPAGFLYRLVKFRKDVANEVIRVLDLAHKLEGQDNSELRQRCTTFRCSNSVTSPPWWTYFIANAKIAIKDVPHSETVLSASFFSTAVDNADCDTCRQTAPGQRSNVKSAILEVYDKAANEVTLDLQGF